MFRVWISVEWFFGGGEGKEVMADDKLLETIFALTNGFTKIGKLFGVVEASMADVGGQAVGG